MGIPLGEAFYEGHVQRHAEQAAAPHARFEAGMRGEDFVSEWRVIDSTPLTVAEALMPHVRCCDLVVAPRYRTDISDHPFEGVAEALAMGAGRPVLMLPAHADPVRFGSFVTVAWDGSQEAARAVFDAIDVLRDAEEVRVLHVREETWDGSNDALPAAEIAATLARKGIRAEADHLAPGDASVRDAILGRVAQTGSDLLVMGLYGHSKLREFVFGGASRALLKHMPVPVLVSH